MSVPKLPLSFHCSVAQQHTYPHLLPYSRKKKHPKHATFWKGTPSSLLLTWFLRPPRKKPGARPPLANGFQAFIKDHYGALPLCTASKQMPSRWTLTHVAFIIPIIMPSDTWTAGQLDQILGHTRRRENSVCKYHKQKQSSGEKKKTEKKNSRMEGVCKESMSRKCRRWQVAFPWGPLRIGLSSLLEGQWLQVSIYPAGRSGSPTKPLWVYLGLLHMSGLFGCLLFVCLFANALFRNIQARSAFPCPPRP